MENSRKICLKSVIIALALTVIAVATFFVFSKFENVNAEAEYFNETEWNSHRLLDSVIPTHYRIHLHPNATQESFRGSIKMHIQLKKTTYWIILHAGGGLSVSRISMRRNNNNVEVSHLFLPKFEMMVLQSSTLLLKGNYTLSMHFNGTMGFTNAGIFQRSYLVKEQESKIIATYLQPTNARHVFPCFDEPKFKVKVQMSVTHDPANIALSNTMQKNHAITKDGLIISHFFTTPPLPVYTVAIVVCNYQRIETSSNGGVLIRVFLSASEWNRGKGYFAIKEAKDSFDLFERTFSISYPLRKIDHVIIPDYTVPGMESYGLVLYRPGSLLLTENDTSTRDKFNVASIIAHETAHMWFGNLVTMEWWNDLWLSEGITSFMEHFAMKTLHPKWNCEQSHLELQTSLRLEDKLNYFSPLRWNDEEVSSVQDINYMFNFLTYRKGKFVSMLTEQVLGSTFMQAINEYLHRFKFSSATTQGFISAMKSVPKVEDSQEILDIFPTWLHEKGYPLVTVSQNSTHVILEQEPFGKQPTNGKTTVWPIKIGILSDQGWSEVIMVGQNLTMKLKSSFVKLNSNLLGYFRVRYEDGLSNKLIHHLLSNHHSIHAQDRSNLIDDFFTLAKYSYINYTKVFQLSEIMRNERDFVVWRTFLRHIIFLQQMLKNTENYNMFVEYIAPFVSRLAHLVKWKPRQLTSTDRYHHYALVRYCIRLGYNFSRNFRNITPESLFDPDITPSNWMIASTEYKGWLRVMDQYTNEEDTLKKGLLLKSLSLNINTSQINRLMKTLIKESSNDRDYFNRLSLVIEACNNKMVLWDWYKDNWKELYTRFENKPGQTSALEHDVAKNFNTNEQYLDVVRFFYQNPDLGPGVNNRMSLLKQIAENILWVKTHAHGIYNIIENVKNY